MPVEWQRDHKTLSPEVKDAFQQEAAGLGLEKLIVEVVKEVAAETSEGSSASRYTIYITDLQHLDRETVTLHAGHGKGWITEFAKLMKYRRSGDRS